MASAAAGTARLAARFTDRNLDGGLIGDLHAVRDLLLDDLRFAFPNGALGLHGLLLLLGVAHLDHDVAFHGHAFVDGARDLLDFRDDVARRLAPATAAATAAMATEPVVPPATAVVAAAAVATRSLHGDSVTYGHFFLDHLGNALVFGDRPLLFRPHRHANRVGVLVDHFTGDHAVHRARDLSFLPLRPVAGHHLLDELRSRRRTRGGAWRGAIRFAAAATAMAAAVGLRRSREGTQSCQQQAGYHQLPHYPSSQFKELSNCVE